MNSSKMCSKSILEFKKMLLRFVYTVLVLICAQAQAQATKDITYEDNSISMQLYTKCFENLNQGTEVFKKYPALKNVKPCSLLNCMSLLAYKEKDIQLAAEERLKEISTQLYKEGNPVCLLMGLDSNLIVEEKNKNLNDDNHLVYITFADYVAADFLNKGAEIINKQTNLLISTN
ncbi:hypothetical protein DCO46_20565 [Flavobacterium sp. HTF]|nr:hypothetical protein DCO46_20565 [Flavobacterium sp. HTF]